ncbi:MAG: cation:proton antiporter [Magnetococcales bacterium]|nr:cation:proton antiporter [Magnetococcales bacterium]
MDYAAVINALPPLPLSIAVAFGFGFLARQVSLPPMVGFVAAGFALNLAGVPIDPAIQPVADYGVTLLLFVIGLKLQIKTLARPEIWGGALIHTTITIVLFSALFVALGAGGILLFTDIDWQTAALVAFALSFSSTVFAVKVLEEKGEMPSLHGRTAVGILVIQDVFAVIFLTVSLGKIPSIWALALFGLIFLRPVLGYLFDRVGHGELLPMFGLFAAVVLGASLFSLVGMKADLGALILGMLMATHPRSSEIAKALFAFKEVFLVGFFLTIGFSRTPTFDHLLVAVLLLPLLLIKWGLFLVLLTRFRLRARSSTLASSILGTYSEFGLIVGAVGVSAGILSTDWLTAIAIAVALSFIFAAPINISSHAIYSWVNHFLMHMETEKRHPDDEPLDIGNAEIVVFGMGRIGTGAYDHFRDQYGDVVIGIESAVDKVAEHGTSGRNVIHGDATDSDFWERLAGEPSKCKVVMLAMPEYQANTYALERIRAGGFQGFVAALAKFQDEVDQLEAAGANVAFNMYGEAGAGFAIQVNRKVYPMMKGEQRARERG